MILGAVAASGLALATHRIEFKLAVPALCALAILHLEARWVIGAFALAALGDYYLSTRSGSEARFIAGIAAYLVAHLGYVAHAVSHGRWRPRVLIGSLAVFVPYYLLALAPAIRHPTLRLAVLAYLIVSCLSLSTAAGLRGSRWIRFLFLGGISLIVFSDLLISLKEFLHVRSMDFLILPTYYAALVFIAVSTLLKIQSPSVPPSSHRSDSALDRSIQ